MTAISEIRRYDINGVVDTGRPVWENIEKLANAANCWATYDITTGKWSVVIKRDQASEHSFSDNNIVGSIIAASTPLNSLYNAVEVQYPDRDIHDGNNFVRADIADARFKANERENVLKLNYPIVNDQIQALSIGLTELEQSRLDLVVSFNTNYTMNAVQAGDIIDITNTAYGWAAKLFRVITIEELDTDFGGIDYKITAQEYSADIYTHDLSRFTLTTEDGVFSIGDIGAMTTPQITIISASQTPHLLVESVFPASGAPITGVEVWMYEITDPAELADWDDPLLYPDENRVYKLNTTVFAENSFVLNSDLDLRIDQIDPGNFLIKLRPINQTTKGPFTGFGSTVTYTVDIAADLSGDSLVDNINGTIGQIAAIPYNDSNTFGPNATSSTAPNWAAGGTPPAQSLATGTFSVLADGLYTVTAIFDQDLSQAIGGRGGLYTGGGTQIYPGEIADWVGTTVTLRDSATTLVGSGGSGGHGAFYWTDFLVTFPVTLTAGELYTIELFYRAYTGANPGGNITFTVNTNVQLITQS